MSWSIVQALHSVPMLLTNLCKYVFLTRYPMPCHTHLPQTEYDEKKPACREEAHSGLAQGQTSLIEEHHGISSATGVRFSRCKKMPFASPDLHDVACRASWWCLDLILSRMLAWSTYEFQHDPQVKEMTWRYCFGPDTWIGTMGRSRTTWHQKQTAKCHCAGDRWQLSFPSTFLQHGEDMKS